jgi:hypothetical protein
LSITGCSFDDLLENIPHFGTLALHQLLGRLDRLHIPLLFELHDDERLEEFEGHVLRQSALVQFQFRADHDHRTSGVVDALAEQVLTEPALLAFEQIGERLQRTRESPRTECVRRPLSSRASTASCSMRFSLRRITSGA